MLSCLLSFLLARVSPSIACQGKAHRRKLSPCAQVNAPRKPKRRLHDGDRLSCSRITLQCDITKNNSLHAIGNEEKWHANKPLLTKRLRPLFKDFFPAESNILQHSEPNRSSCKKRVMDAQAKQISYLTIQSDPKGQFGKLVRIECSVETYSVILIIRD